MSSLQQSFAQPPARTLFNERGAEVVLASDITRVFQGYNNVIFNGSMITFPDEETFADACFDLFDNNFYATDEQTSLLDMGKKIYLGISSNAVSTLAGESQVVTLSLVKVLQGTNRDLVGYVVTASNINEYIYENTGETLDVDVGIGAA